MNSAYHVPSKVMAIIRDIKSLKIQGARNVAASAVKALSIMAQESKESNTVKFSANITKTAKALSASRPTEPMMRNMLDASCRHCFAQMNSGEIKTVEQARIVLIKKNDSLLTGMETDAKKLAQAGARLIPKGATVLTHCHSSTTTRVLMEAHRTGRNIRVICFETRPRWQGRLTATELAGAGLDVTLSVDGGMNQHMKKADLVIVGADSITSRGDLINKIGTSTLAHLARMHDISFYSAAELLKYSPDTLSGTLEKIESRNPAEVWEHPPRGVKIFNPAFEVTSSRLITAFITEAGIVPPQNFFIMAGKKIGINID